MERALDARTVIIAELPHVVGHMLEVGGRNGAISQQDFASRYARFGLSTEVEHYLQKLCRVGPLVKSASEVRGQCAR